MTSLLEGGACIFPGHTELRIQTNLSSRPEESWACGPRKVMKSTSVRHPLSVEPVPLPCHPDRSEAERRDLRFRGPFVEMFFDRAQRSGEICGFFSGSHTPSKPLRYVSTTDSCSLTAKGIGRVPHVRHSVRGPKTVAVAHQTLLFHCLANPEGERSQ
jgi:hypothetical protein